MKKIIVASAIASLFLGGCTMRVADLTMASTKNYNLVSSGFVKGERVQGEDTAPVVVFPLGIPNMKTAIDRAIEKNKCSVALTDVVITQLNQAFVFGRIGYRVEGTQVIDTTQPNCGRVSSKLADLSKEKPLMLSPAPRN